LLGFGAGSIVVPVGQALSLVNGKLPNGIELTGVNLSIAGTATFAQAAYTNAGNVTLQSGGALTFGGAFANAAPGMVTIPAGAVLTASGPVNGNGRFDLQGGTLAAPGGVTLNEGAMLSGRGEVLGRLSIPTGTSAAMVAVGGTLAVGDPNSTAGVDVDRLIGVGNFVPTLQSGTLLLLDADHAMIGSTVIERLAGGAGERAGAARGRRCVCRNSGSVCAEAAELERTSSVGLGRGQDAAMHQGRHDLPVRG
jgi:hypothetical protein